MRQDCDARGGSSGGDSRGDDLLALRSGFLVDSGAHV